MFLWFVATAVLAVGFVFRDPRFDHRLLIVGAVLPVAEAPFGGARVLHSVTASVAVLAVLMIATAGRKPIRRMLLGLPIGMFLHLVFDGAWNDTDTFWWPFTGTGFADDGLPITEGGAVRIVLEIVGIALCVWLWSRNGLGDRTRRREFLHDGRLAALPDRLG